MDVIWNLTRVCPWDCKICCISALHVCQTTQYFLQVMQKEKGRELTLAKKLMVLKSLVDEDCEIDFSGGDPLYYDEDVSIIEQATWWLPSNKISVSMTGSKMTDAKIELLKKVGVVEFTLDNLPETENPFRPLGFNLASMIAMKKCIEAGVRVRAVTVFYSNTISRENLENLYSWLCENKIPEWELLRFYPVGRAAKFTELIPSHSEYLEAMKFLRELHGFTRVFFQHSLKILEGTIKCSAAIDSIGILPDGQVTACAWAIDNNCFPLEGFYLGKLPDDNLDEILDKARTSEYYSKRIEFCRTINYISKKGAI